ncbi:alpha/beta fold hydrolase [Sphingobium baderi]|uniref:AB hydrolase-1 domain-containing protein n=1 Tax=Sphingobium baderi TaxID=1332080 RepID=A0A0S3F627_9SPHN|nr:alpha/beta hydrolase [Sphingobium baderi]ALR23097.1 hypothetical protein ATN00_21675 [Sphingobium baderi]
MSIDPENGTLNLGGHRIACTRVGRGPAVALIHGIPTHRHLWRNVIPTLVSAGREVIALDLLGYGDSDKPQDADLGILAQADIVAKALRMLGWERGAIVGHDIGGGIAQLIALAEPEMFDRLILVDSIVYDSFPEPGIARLKEPVWDDILGAPDFDLKKGLAKGLSRGMVHGEKVTSELIDAYERPFSGVEGRRAYLRAARALRTEELATRSDAIERLNVPTLIIWGAKDVFQPIELGIRLAAALTNGRFERIDQAGHFLPEDAPDELAALILPFLAPSRGA